MAQFSKCRADAVNEDGPFVQVHRARRLRNRARQGSLLTVSNWMYISALLGILYRRQ